MIWWNWMILGAVLLGAELLAIDAQFYLVFLGISAALVGFAGMLGMAMPDWAQWVAFAVLSLVFMVTFRKNVYGKIRGGAKGFRATISGDSVKLASDLAPGADSRVKYRGTDWTVLNVGNTDIANGSSAKIVKVDGLTLHVSAD